MNDKFVEFLARLPGRDDIARAEMARKADAVVSQLTALLGQMDLATRRSALDQIAEEVVARSAMPADAVGLDGRPTPELLDWARRTFDIDAHLAGVREIERGGGVELKEILKELEQGLGRHE